MAHAQGSDCVVFCGFFQQDAVGGFQLGVAEVEVLEEGVGGGEEEGADLVG